MRERVICRFATEADLHKFNLKNGISLTADMKEYDVHSHEFKAKRTHSKVSQTKREYWDLHWNDMPQYVSEKQQVFAKIEFKFDSEDLDFAREFFAQDITDRTTSVWFPKLVAGTYSKKRFVGGSSETRYPIYVVSKGRADKCTTSTFLSQMEVKHFVVVEPQEYLAYKKAVENEYATILELDIAYKRNYYTFDDLGDSKPKGAGAARNFCWEHSIGAGYKRHWVFDDNATEGFHYMYHNEKIKLRSGAFFRALEDFVDRYENIAIAGLNYSKFCKMQDKTPAFVMNTRIYSFLLIQNDIPYRWRGRYNEDTDLSLRVLKDGWCTVQFNALLAGKVTTQRVQGGNTAEFYAKEGTLPKSQMLADMHPDVAKVVWKFNRYHHYVDYSSFTQELKFASDYVPSNRKVNMYGMVCIDTDEVATNDTKTYLENKYKNKITEVDE